MSHITCAGQLDFLSAEQKAKLTKRFKSVKIGVMPRQIAVSLGMKRDEALAVVTILEANGLCENRLLIYHVCEPDTIADWVPLREGFPNRPWYCPLCEESIEEDSELSFDIMSLPFEAIEFI